MQKSWNDRMIRLKIATELSVVTIVTILCVMIVDARSIGSNSQAAVRDTRNSQNNQTNAADTQAQTITLNLNLNGQIKTLTLKKNDNVPSNTPVYVFEKGRVTQWTDPKGQEVSAYVNMNTFDALTMSQLPSATEFIGVFHDGIQRYSLAPARSSNAITADNSTSGGLGSSGEPSYGINTTYTVYIDGTKHVVIRQDETAEGDIDELSAPVLPSTVVEQPRNGPPMVGASIKQQYIVEYVAVIDYSIYNRWLSSSTQTTASLKRQDAMRNIRTYYAHVVNEIDMRFSTIINSELSVNVRFVGYYVMTTPEDSSFTEGLDVIMSRNGVLYTNANTALVKFASFVANNTQLFGSADHVALFTDNLLTDGVQTSNGYKTISGLAYIGSICDVRQKVSLSREFGQYSVIQSAAHELAHNLGALHDGDNNNCNSADQFIMATSPGQLTAANFNNTFRFSSCSVASIVNKLSAITSAGISCLLHSGNESMAIVDSNPIPGQTYNVDQQCQQLYGAQSFYCAGNTNDQTICSKMLCWDPDANRCAATLEQRAADGTTCGNRRWCQLGQCVAASAAPPTNDSCIYGDNRGYIDENLTCAQMGREQPRKCYDEGYTRSHCCQTCAAVRAVDRPGCEYGDHDANYCANKSLSSCYDATFSSICCATCWRKASNDSCAYGDRNNWCSDGWLNCYDDGTRMGCCQTCPKFYTGVSGCEYGDRVPWCGSSQYSNDMSSWCKDASFAQSCCHSCAPFLIASTTSPTPPVSTVRSSTTSMKTTPANTSTTSSTSTTTTTQTSSPSSTTTASPTVKSSTVTVQSSTLAPSKSTTTASAEISTTTPTTTTTTTTTTTSTTQQSSTLRTLSAILASTTVRPTTTATASLTVSPDDVINPDHCSNVTAGRCFEPNAECCEKCSNLYTGIGGCEYGDLNTQCKEIVRGPVDCQQPAVASACCKTCAFYQKHDCVDKAGWCSRISSIFSGWCYDEAVRSTCCATCSRQRRNNSCCPYGDQYEWCRKEYCWINARECCATC